MLDNIDLGEFDYNRFLKSYDSNIATITNSENAPLQIVFVIDASNSMQGYRIGAVNEFVNNSISLLGSLDHNREKPIGVSVIGFSSRLFKWTDSFVRASNFIYSYVEMTDGVTDFSAAIDEISLLTETKMKKDSKKYVILFSDGLATDSYKDSLSNWRRSALYSDVMKIAVSFEDDLCDPQSMEFFVEFTDGGMIIPISAQEQLLKAILK